MICDNCKGTGKIKKIEIVRRVLVEQEIECPKCNGKGHVPEHKKENKIEKTENIEG
jgi:DnaJ-class molecular chaperone